jgi:hypothetical protein
MASMLSMASTTTPMTMAHKLVRVAGFDKSRRAVAHVDGDGEHEKFGAGKRRSA